MSTLPNPPVIKLPTEPYPGLRPFLDHEASLLLGRSSQVQEVIKRLEQTRFVAVVGGSGSGKSSLIRAGVVPKLRGYGIREAGTYWIPVIFTPGSMPHTTSAAGDPATRQQSRRRTPITRLAWKLSQALVPLATLQDEAERRDEIATVFRQGAGFTRLIDAYHDELPRLGPDSKDARFLFVIDQFEELFHPNNRGNADAQQLVEAVIDHFFNPHERCFVVMTMRSEHLADCASYLELPDAINKSLYLVRRLNEQEIRDAIVGPAKYYLRLLQRGNQDQQTTLASDVVFEEPVIGRLLKDVAAIAGDTDHLPLLQHVLARTWEVACRRENAPPGGVPAEVRWVDLEHAVAPGSDRPDGWLHDHDGINTLRGSLENWAEFLYRQHPPDERAQIDTVLRNLAFKDPNNGLYFQQRVDVDSPLLLSGYPQPRQRLLQLLGRGFLDSVNYMFWDDEHPDRIALKVSHEAFIRGWERFRKLIDLEADRFEEFVAVLRKCALWRVERLPRLLLEASELARVESAHLGAVFEASDERKAWFHVLLQYRDGERLAKIEPDVDQFLAASRRRLEDLEREKREAIERERSAKEAERLAIEQARESRRLQEISEREHEAQRKQDQADLRRIKAEKERADAVIKRNRWFVLTAIGYAVICSVVGAFAVFIQGPALVRVADFADARFRVERRTEDSTNDPGAGLTVLSSLVTAARLVERANTGTPIWRWSPNQILHRLGFIPPVTKIQELLANSSSEPYVNGTLHNVLTSTVWPSKTDPADVPPDRRFDGTRRELSCATPRHAAHDGTTTTGTEVRMGSLFLGQDPERGIFIPKLDTKDTEITLYDATFQGNQCTGPAIIWSVPSYLKPAILFNAQLSHLAVALTDASSGHDYVNLYGIVWGPDQNTSALVPVVKFLSVVPDPSPANSLPAAGAEGPPSGRAAQLVRQEVASHRRAGENVPQVKMIATWPTEGGFETSVADKAWRVFSDTALPINTSAEKRARDWSTLEKPAAESGCDRLDRALAVDRQRDGSHVMFQNGAACFDIQRGGPSQSAGAGPTTNDSRQSRAVRERVLVTVYTEPQLLDSKSSASVNLPPPIANLSFGLVAPDPGLWLIGKTGGNYEYWIALEQPLGTLLAGPWGTTALRKLGEQVLGATSAPPSQTANAVGAR